MNSENIVASRWLVATLWVTLGLVACGDRSVGTGGSGGATGLAGSEVIADYFTRKTVALMPGQIELITLSTMPDTVTGEDVLVGVRGLTSGDVVQVLRNGVDVSMSFQRVDASEVRGLVSGLAVGTNALSATVTGAAGTRTATLTVIDHPITGPVLSGPHQTPFVCETQSAGLGAPTDTDCSVPTLYQWYYKSISDQGFHLLVDPYTAYPSDTSTTTTDGKVVPFVVRVESATINRGITRIAVLDDPAARGAGKPFSPTSWNGRIYYAFGESCGPGYHQGHSEVSYVLGGVPDPTNIDVANTFIRLIGVTDQLGRGDITIHSTLSAFGTHCNSLVSMETAMMVKEHVNEQYGLVKEFVGTSGSGASMQQYNVANNAPGLMTAMLPIASFPDIVSLNMTIADCTLMVRYFAGNGSGWTTSRRAEVYGQLPLPDGDGTCESFAKEFEVKFHPDTGCDPAVPQGLRYSATTNPSGARCTFQDANVNILGRDPTTGFARRPLDNVGVQYGLGALNDGAISVDEFLDLNAKVGGFDIDGNYIGTRMRMDSEVAARLYQIGQIIGRGSLAQTPNMDLGTYFDLFPGGNVHSAVYPFTTRARLRAHSGQGQTMSQFRGVVSEPDVYPIMADWFTAITRSNVPPNDHAARVAAVLAAKPAAAADRCIFATAGGGVQAPGKISLLLGVQLPILPNVGGPVATVPFKVDVAEPFETPTTPIGPCQTALPVKSTPRLVAGMPLTNDVIRCQLKPIDLADYTVPLTVAQLSTLKSIFPVGVCDYTKPAAEDVEQSMAWPSIGGTVLEAPHSLVWRVARSASGS